MKFLRLILIIFLSLNTSSQELEIGDISPDLLNNLSPDQIAQIENLQTSQTQVQETNNTDTVESLVEEEEEKINDIVNIPRKFGFDYFSKIPTSITPTQDLPVPLDYRISLKDQISILLSGSKDAVYSLRVNLDGTIQFPELGAISVVNKSLAQVNDEINNLVQASYVGVDVDVNITNLSAKKITIVGAVNIPGVYLVNPFSTLSNVLAYAGGVKEYASLRQINLIKPNGKTHVFDLYDLLIYGDRTNDITIDAGDTILIKGTSKFVAIEGEVVRPGIYEYLENESVDNLLNFALGLTGLANKDKISAIKVDPENLTINNEQINIGENIPLKEIVSIRAFQLGVNTELDVLVEGPISNAGYFKLDDYKNLANLISDLKFTDVVYPYIAIIEQFDPVELTSSREIFSLTDPESYKTIELNSNDKILFFSRLEFSSDSAAKFLSNFSEKSKQLLDAYYISLNYNRIDGQIESYELPIFGNYSIQDLVDFIGINYEQFDGSRVILKNTDEPRKTVAINEPINANKFQQIDLYEKNKLFIQGATVYGDFTLDENITLSDLISNISFDESVYPFAGVVENFDPVNQKKSVELFSLLDESTQNIQLNNYSKVFFLNKSNYLNTGKIGLEARSLTMLQEFSLALNYKNETIRMPTYGKFNANQIIDFMGFDLSGLEIGQTTYIKPLKNITLVTNFENITLESAKFHSLSFRFRVSDLIVVSVLGQANLPGSYTLEAGTTVRELYKLFGGFKENASEKNIIFQRQSVRTTQLNALKSARKTLREFLATNSQQGNQNLNAGLISFLEEDIEPDNLGRIGGDFSTSGKLIDDFILVNGDIITIPTKRNTVSIIGEVLNPNTVIYEKNLSLRDYIDKAGGYKQFALRKDTYIIKANGSIQRTGRNIFIRSYKIEPGDVIVIPRDMAVYNQSLPTITAITSIISNLAFSAASLNVIQDN